MTDVPIVEILFLVSLIAPPSQEWEQWTKLILSVAVPLLIVSGGLFFVAWKAFKSGKDTWTALALEFLLTEEFGDQVTECLRRFVTSDEFERCVNKIRREKETEFIDRIRIEPPNHAVHGRDLCPQNNQGRLSAKELCTFELSTSIHLTSGAASDVRSLAASRATSARRR